MQVQTDNNNNMIRSATYVVLHVDPQSGKDEVEGKGETGWMIDGVWC